MKGIIRAGRSRLACLVGTLLAWASASTGAEAAVTAVQGTVTNAQSITVTGTGFGATGPHVVLFDDFESGASGSFVNLSGPEIGTWTTQKNYPKYDSTYKRSGNNSLAISNNTPVDIGAVCGLIGGPFCDGSANWQNMRLRLTPAATRIFWTVWHYLPAGHHYPVESVGDINWKQTWVYGTAADWTETAENDWFIPVLNEQHHSSNNELPQAGSNAGYTGTNCGQSMYPMYYTRAREVGQWIRTSIYLDGSTNCAGTLQLWEIPFVNSSALGFACGDARNTCQMLRKQRTGITTQSEPWNGFSMNAYARTNGAATDLSYSRWDDMYVASGPGAQARVEIANNRTWGDATHGADMNMTICTPNSWSATTVNCTVRQGSFAAGQPAFLFVIDANGVVSDQDTGTAGAQGFPVTFGTGQPETAPAQVQNVERTDVKP